MQRNGPDMVSENESRSDRRSTFIVWMGLVWCGVVLAAYHANNWEYYITKVSTFAAYLGL